MKPTTRKMAIGSVVAGLTAVGGFGLVNAAPSRSDGATSAVVVAQNDFTTDTVVETDPSTDSDPATDTDTPTDTTVEHDRPEWREHTGELLTGDIADQVTAAALVAVPGGTVERVETDDDHDGSVYEAHMTDSDGNRVTVTFDEDVNVVEIREGGHFGRSGFGHGGFGRGDHDGGGHGDRNGCDDAVDTDADTEVES